MDTLPPLVELLTPRQSSLQIEEDLRVFEARCAQVLACGTAQISIPDNPLGHPRFTATEVLASAAGALQPERILVHLNTCHRRADLEALLEQAAELGIRRLLCVTGDGGPRLPKLAPADLGADGPAATSVELLAHIRRRYPDRFVLGAAFNPYEPPEHELVKLRRKFAAGAQFIVTQPVMADHGHIRALADWGRPVWIGAWMSRRLDIFYQCIGREPPAGEAAFDPFRMLASLRTWYPGCGLYLSLLNFKSDWCTRVRECLPR